MSSFYKSFEAYIKGDSDEILDWINADEKGDAIERLAIYRDAYVIRLVDILYGDFPIVYEILGTEVFMEMAKDYVKTYPSTSFTVRHFGQNLAKYLMETQPYSGHTYLSQMADFEWAKGTVFDAPDTPIYTLDQLAAIPLDAWERVRFQFVPAMTRLIYDYNIPQIWQAVKDGKQGQEPTTLDIPMPWVMWRKKLNPNWYSMPDYEDWFFIQARKGVNFSALCEGLAKWIDDEEEIAQQAAVIVRRWIDEEMLSDILID